MNRLLLSLSFLLAACGGGGEDAARVSSNNPGGLLLNETHGDGGGAWGVEACDACHALSVIHENSSKEVREMVRDKGYDTCTGCHGSNGTQAGRQCLICHNERDLPGYPYLDGRHSHGFSDIVDAELSDDDCLVCHRYSDMNGVFDLNLDLSRFADANGQFSDYLAEAEFCLRCHNRDHQQPGYDIIGDGYDDPLIALEDDYRYIDYHGWRDGSGQGTYYGLRDHYRYPQLVDCGDCHAMHGSANSKLIIDRSDKGAGELDGADLSGAPYRIDIGDQGDYSQLCVICHQMTLVSDEGDVATGNGLSGVHLVGDDCRPCHTHGEASQAGL
jgi:hypothetical protein